MSTRIMAPTVDNGKIPLTIPGLISLVSAFSPIFITFFILMLTCMNQNFKGLIFIAGVIISLGFNLLIMKTIKSENFDDASLTCSLIDLPVLGSYNSPSNASLFISFTFTYLFIPMIYNNQMNYPVIILLLSLFIMDSYMRVENKCTTHIGVFLGWFVGMLCGALWFAIFHSNGADKFLYFNDLGSNSVRCERPSKQKFKCSVFKNGVLVSQNIA